MIDIVIVNWNSGKQTLKCIESLQANDATYIEKIIVVDNNSSDKSENLIYGLKGVEFIKAKTNLGFAKACNLGSKYCSSEFILFLNPDTVVFHETLDKTFKFMTSQENSQIGICGVQLLSTHNKIARSCARFPTVKSLVLHAIGLDRIIPKTGATMHEWNHENSAKVDQVIGAFFLIRRTLFCKLNGFDERFFVYYEEVDLSYRARLIGFHSYYLTETQAFHKGGGASEQVKALRLFYSNRSRIIYADKHFSLASTLLIILVTCTIEPITRLLLILVKRKNMISSTGELVKAYFMLYSWLIKRILWKKQE